MNNNIQIQDLEICPGSSEFGYLFENAINFIFELASEKSIKTAVDDSCVVTVNADFTIPFEESTPGNLAQFFYALFIETSHYTIIHNLKHEVNRIFDNLEKDLIWSNTAIKNGKLYFQDRRIKMPKDEAAFLNWNSLIAESEDLNDLRGKVLSILETIQLRDNAQNLLPTKALGSQQKGPRRRDDSVIFRGEFGLFENAIMENLRKHLVKEFLKNSSIKNFTTPSGQSSFNPFLTQYDLYNELKDAEFIEGILIRAQEYKSIRSGEKEYSYDVKQLCKVLELEFAQFKNLHNLEYLRLDNQHEDFGLGISRQEMLTTLFTGRFESKYMPNTSGHFDSMEEFKLNLMSRLKPNGFIGSSLLEGQPVKIVLQAPFICLLDWTAFLQNENPKMVFKLMIKNNHGANIK